MARATIIVEVWSPASGWIHVKGYTATATDERLALRRAETLEHAGAQVRVYRCTPEGSKVIYESPRS